MASQHASRVTGHIQERQLKSGPVFYLKTRVPGRDPEQTTTRLGPAHKGKGRPLPGTFTRRMAEDALAEFLTDARRGTLEVTQQDSGVTFADAAAEYLRFVDQEKGVQQSTLGDYRSVVDGYLLERFGDVPIERITSDDVNAYKLELLNAGRLSKRTVLRHLLVLNGIFDRAETVWQLPGNVASAKHVHRPKVQYSGEFDMLDQEQLAALCRAAESPQDATLYLTAAMTGLRQGELRALQWRDVDFVTDRLHVRRSATTGANPIVKAPKSGRVRSVPMVRQLAVALDSLSRREHFTGDSELVFPNAVGGVENDCLQRRRYQRALKRAGLPHVRFHDLRHVFGSTAVREFPLSDVQAMLGHAHVTTTMRYVHYRPGADDARRLESAFSGHAGDTNPVADLAQKRGKPSDAGLSEEAPTGIEPVYTALQAAA
jgi:integrase